MGIRLIKFRLSTVFLVITILAAILGWFVDHRATWRRFQVVGEWRHPTAAPLVEKIDVHDQCRCGINESGYLLIQRVGGLPPGGDIGLRWEAYERHE